MSTIRLAIPQGQQEGTTMVHHVVLMPFSLFEYNFNNNFNPIKQQTYDVYTHNTQHTYSYIQGIFLVTRHVHGSVLHRYRCIAGHKAHTIFADDSACLVADKVWNEGK
jgi:hypothetical protein